MALGIGTAVMGGLSLLGGLGSAIGSAVYARRAANEQRRKGRIIDAQGAEDTAIFNKQYYQDMTKRTEVQNMMRMLAENQKKADTRASAQAAIMGSTPEQQLASQEVNRSTFADAVANIASNASQMRDQYLRDYQGQRNRYYQQRLGMQDELAGIERNTSNQWATAATNAFKGGANMLGKYFGA